ncbi:RagB/SusD family nutrient uptake outer membrane protein [Prevotella sp. P5-126]|uniref:RagB/SusD family nutrient uptake outer membrane protein n=1 Tax=Prevotella sp. P5-126 TaxID=2024216 RepID=UPI000B97A40B|nr:RagB/SusD family nutrient uptake outer membrane protein [Prevotella sp. P5-126]OYP38581.1 RagB/SusD family nutrient uptake outer membrane protein [Prevotella sp. P5-126]
MKKTIKYFSFGLLTVAAFSACSDSFLEEKKNYDNVNKDVYNYIEGANGRLNDLYAWSLPQVSNISWKYPSCGNADDAAKSTEEYSGFGAFVDPQNELSSTTTGTSVPDYFKGSDGNIQELCYGRIRNINDFIKNIKECTLSEDNKNIMLGQAYFLRAWCYYNLVKWYGGVPLVTEPLDPVETSFTNRSSAEASINFILEDLKQSAELLEAKTTNGGWDSDNWGRVTTGTALALKGRVLLLWASPLFNRDNDESRWTNAYTEMKADLAKINACGYGLYQTANNVNGSDFAAQFTQVGQNPEAVFVTLHNNIKGTGADNQKNNNWENGIRPKNTCGSGKNASAMLVDMFPMADGKIPEGMETYTKLPTSKYTYDANYPFMDRDPRFYRTFAMPGFRWAYNGDASSANANNPSDGKNYVLWNYVWYTTLDDQGNAESGNSYGADNLLASRQGIYVRKKSDDLDVNPSALYTYNPTQSGNGAPFHSAAQLIELRYAEVLLNLAEVACGAGQLNDAVGYVNQVRQRAGVPAYDLPGDQATCMSEILYERQVEFAYEGKRFDDMRRWLLFDGGANFASIGAKVLKGWGGNTCTWLGFKPFNGQRRENMEFRTADKYGVGKTTYDSDPLLKAGVTRPAGVDLRNDLTDQLETLKSWYGDNLVRKLKKGDARETNGESTKVDLYTNFRAKYYFLGFSSAISEKNIGLPQTIGWEDANNGGAMGTFDPLTAE